MIIFILFNRRDGMSANLISARVAAAEIGVRLLFALEYLSCTKNTGRIK